MPVNSYLDVAVVRIQSWLSRTQVLRGRRGASTMLREATSPENIDVLLGNISEIATRNTAAGNIDGVIALELHTTDPDSVSTVEHLAVRHLRRHLPAAQLRVTRWEGADSTDAHASGEPVAEHDWPPAVPEWAPGKACTWCSAWCASHEHVEPNGDRAQQLCADCELRERNAGYSSTPRAELKPGPERDLRDRWQQRHTHLPQPGFPNMFAHLVALGEQRDNTHLATIHADGDSIGDFAERLCALQNGGSGSGFELAEAVSETTWEALLDALDAIASAHDPELPIIAHLVGGDDVFVSVPAHRCWEFVRVLQNRFSERFETRLAEAGVGTLTPPSLSAAIVIHHRTSPLSLAVDLAETALHRTKSTHRGQNAAMTWHDITHDGPELLADRGSLSLRELNDAMGGLDALAELSASSRSQLATLERKGNHAGREQQTARMDIEDTVAPFVDGARPHLLDALGMVRWWRKR